MNYKIIHDDNELKRFISNLSDTDKSTRYFLSLLARKKYITNNTEKIRDLTVCEFTCTKKSMYNKIRQLEVPVGSYYYKDSAIPQESLALYIQPNQVNMTAAINSMGRECWNMRDSQNYNLESTLMACIKKSRIRSYVDFDIDHKDIDLHKLKNILPDIEVYGDNMEKEVVRPYTIVETKSGYHILVNIDVAKKSFKLTKSFHDNWQQNISTMYHPDVISSKTMVPVPGSIQGGFVPKVVII